MKKIRWRSHEFVHRWGLWRALYSQAMQLAAKMFGLRVARINRRTLLSDIDIPELPGGYAVRQLTNADYEAAVKDAKLSTSAEFVETARAQGSFCVGAFYGGELVSYVWRAFGTTLAQDGFSLVLQKPNRYGYKALTLPDHRGLHLQNVITLFSDRTCIEMGYTYAISYIETHNYASILSDARRGNECVGWISWISRGRFRWCYTSRGARAIGVELVDHK